MKKLAVVYLLGINLDKIDEFRKEYDPNWNIIKPHITLVSPILDISKDILIQYVREVIKDTRAFSVNLSGLTKSFDDYLFLQVKKGKKEIINIHNKLYSGILNPYSSNDSIFFPHITLGYFRTVDDKFNIKLYRKAYDEALKMNININCKFDNITILRGDGLTPTEIIKTFDLNY